MSILSEGGKARTGCAGSQLVRGHPSAAGYHACAPQRQTPEGAWRCFNGETPNQNSGSYVLALVTHKRLIIPMSRD